MMARAWTTHRSKLRRGARALMTPTWRSVIEKLQNIYILLTTSKICTHNLSQQDTMGGWGFDKRICRGNSEEFVHPPNFLESEVMFSSRYDELGIFCAN